MFAALLTCAAMRLGRPTDIVRYDLANRPARRVERGAPIVALFAIPFGVIFGGIPAAGIVADIAELGFRPAQLALVPFVLVGLAAIALGVVQLTARREVVIDVDEVTVRDRLFLRDRVWTEPIEAYRGVRRRLERVPAKRNRPELKLYCVDLVHPDRTRTIELRRTQSKAGWEDAEQASAAELGVAVLERTSSGGPAG